MMAGKTHYTDEGSGWVLVFEIEACARCGKDGMGANAVKLSGVPPKRLAQMTKLGERPPDMVWSDVAEDAVCEPCGFELEAADADGEAADEKPRIHYDTPDVVVARSMMTRSVCGMIEEFDDHYLDGIHALREQRWADAAEDMKVARDIAAKIDAWAKGLVNDAQTCLRTANHLHALEGKEG